MPAVTQPKPPKAFVLIDKQPAVLAPQDTPSLAINGDGRGRDYHNVRITGADTVPDPITGWNYHPEFSYRFGVLYSEAGHNHARDKNEGRTGVFKDGAKIYHRGKGDLGWMFGNLFIDTPADADMTSVLAGPAVVLLAAGFGTNYDHGYFNPIEFRFDDRGFDTAAAGLVVNHVRSNDNAERGQFWFHCRSQAQESTKPIDAVWSHTGPAKVGMDVAKGVFVDDAAITFAEGHRWYFNAIPIDNNPSGVYRFPQLTPDYATYDQAVGGFVVTIGGTPSFCVRNGTFGPVTPPVISGSWGDGTAGKSLVQALAALGLCIDETTD